MKRLRLLFEGVNRENFSLNLALDLDFALLLGLVAVLAEPHLKVSVAGSIASEGRALGTNNLPAGFAVMLASEEFAEAFGANVTVVNFAPILQLGFLLNVQVRFRRPLFSNMLFVEA
jgi:hypothetical protein